MRFIRWCAMSHTCTPGSPPKPHRPSFTAELEHSSRATLHTSRKGPRGTVLDVQYLRRSKLSALKRCSNVRTCDIASEPRKGGAGAVGSLRAAEVRRVGWEGRANTAQVARAILGRPCPVRVLPRVLRVRPRVLWRVWRVRTANLEGGADGSGWLDRGEPPGLVARTRPQLELYRRACMCQSVGWMLP